MTPLRSADPPAPTAPTPPPGAPAPLPRLGDALPILTRILRYALPYKRQLAATFLAVLGTAVFVLLLPLVIRWAIDTGLGVKVVSDTTTVSVDKGLLVVAGLALLGVALARGLFQFVQAYLAEWVAQTVAYDIRNRLYERLQTLSFAFHDEAETGHVMVRATQDVEVVRMFLNFGGVRLVFTFLLMVSITAVMVVMNWQLALVVWGFLMLMGVQSFRTSRTLRPVWVDVQEGQARLGTVLQEALSGIRVVKAFGREDFEGRKFHRVARWLYERSYRASRVMALNQPILTGIWMASLAATIWIGGVQIVHDNLTLGELTGFLIYLQFLQGPVRMLGFMVMVVPRAASAGTRIFELLDTESAVQERPGALPPAAPQGRIRFEHVSFAYDPRSSVLRDVDFEAKPGEIVALLGPTGSGKTTIVNLLPRFYDVTEGRVLLDGVDVRDLSVDGLRRQIAVVQQDVFLFSATLRDNIAYGRPDASDEEVEAAARLARVHEHIASLPAGYATWVGERGMTLSGGQKQRIAIARALLMDPRVLIFDDSTSSVDTRTELEIQAAMAVLMRGRTTFIIAHRLRSVRNADLILVLDQGRIVQHGTHTELLAQGGLYREIYDLELRDQEEAFAPVAGGGGA